MLFTKTDMLDFAKHILRSDSDNTLSVELEAWIKKVKTPYKISRDAASGLTKLLLGTKPSDLDKEEIKSLDKNYPGWFEKLGYTEPNYKRPVV